MIEFLGLFSKALALCIRLFANMIAGHMLIIVMLCMIFMFKTLWLAPVSVVGAVALSVLEVFVCFLQAYVFTLLTALFVGAAINPQH
jgi:F-type H+-transporting ATPase subunit a